MKDLDAFSETLELLSFPESYREPLCSAAEILVCSEVFTQTVEDVSHALEVGTDTDWEGKCGAAEKEGKASGVHPYTAALVFFLMLRPSAQVRYAARGLAQSDCINALTDLRLKTEECVKVYHVIGVFTSWFGRFFEGTRLLCCRLQCEDVGLRYPFAGFSAGDKVINIHIPELGPLTDEACERSFAAAVKAFPDCVRNGRAVFVCSSWLLAHELDEMLPKSSNIVKFKDRFTVLGERREEGFPDAWRIYGDRFSLPAAELPRDTALQRGYAERLEKYGYTTVAYGAFEYPADGK